MEPGQHLQRRFVQIAIYDGHRTLLERVRFTERGHKRFFKEALDQMGAGPIHAVKGKVALNLLAAGAILPCAELPARVDSPHLGEALKRIETKETHAGNAEIPGQ